MYSTELKIKRLSLAAESRIIRLEKRRQKARHNTDTVESLHNHRVGRVRTAARAAHLAHAYLKGRFSATVEDPRRTRKPVIEGFVVDDIRTFGDAQFRMDRKDLTKAVRLWVDGGAPVSVEASNPQTAGSTPAAAAIAAA